MQFDRYWLNGSYYGVKDAIDIDGYVSLTCYYMDNPNQDILVSIEYDYFDYIDEIVDRLYIYNSSDESNYAPYYLITPQGYDELVALNDEAMNSQPNFIDDTIIEKTFTTFKNKIRGNYSGASVLYHSSSYSGANVSYDRQTKTYTCTMTAEYSTNAFDFWGTSTQTYFVTAQFLDTGSDLAMISFNVS